MLEVGNGDLNAEEAKSHFALWAILKAPLILGNDLRSIDKDTLDIISNPELISISQDKLATPPTLALQENNIDVWVGPLSDGYVFAVLKKNDAAANYTLDFTKHNVVPRLARLRDVVNKVDIKDVSQSIDLTLPAHGIKVIKASLTQRLRSN